MIAYYPLDKWFQKPQVLKYYIQKYYINMHLIINNINLEETYR